ncbi:MAG: endo-1,4-beta-xylanase [Caulobacteraceae bacterium]|nr:endo-1,4-beta-xylanase [Caulobacteraceae bacterium]
MALTPTRRDLLAGAAAAIGAPSASVTASQSYPVFRALAARRGLLWGSAVEPQVMDADADFAALVRRECAVLTPENAMKWNALRPAPGQFDFSAADRVVALARAQNAYVHGHCLAWHEAMPDWLMQALNPSTGRELLTGHILSVVSRYAGQVRSWDVVNEGVERADYRPDGLRASPWLKALGPGYIDLAFHTAHEADPRARLGFADYGLEYDDVRWMVEKRCAMLIMLKGLLARGVPIDALALQGHLDAARPPSFGPGLGEFLDRVADLGLEIYVTELDVSDQTIPGDPAARDQVVAGVYHAFLERVLRQPAVRMVNTWGLADRHTSKTTFFPRADGQPVRPLPFDADLQPKPAAFAIAEVLTGAY